MLRTESQKTGRPKNKPSVKKLNSEWIPAQKTSENRTSKERAGWKTSKKKQQKTTTKKSHTEERKEPYNALERREREKKKQPEEKEATRKVKKGRKTLKRT